MELLEKACPLLDTMVHDITGRKTRSLHADISTISTRTGERIITIRLPGPVLFGQGND